MQILASGKTGAQRYDDNNVNKPVADLDIIEISQQSQRAFEETQGWSYSNVKGSSESEAADLSVIEEADVGDYDQSFAQMIQTFVANNSYLEVNGSSTANNIILEPRKIADVNSPNGANYAKAASLPFTFRDNLKFTFRATETNTGAVQFSITGLSGLSGAIDSIDELGSALTGGEIVAGSFYDIVTTGTATTKKVILRVPSIADGTTLIKGKTYLPNPITISNGTDADHDIDFTAGNFNFDDGSGQGKMTAKTGELDAAFGTGDGMLDTGTIAADSIYHLFTVYNPATGDSKPLASSSKTSPTMTLPNADGYTILGKRIAALHTDGSANIRTGFYAFFHGGYKFIYDNFIIDFDSGSVSNTKANILMSAPPDSFIRVKASMGWNGSAEEILIFDANQNDTAPTTSNFDLLTSSLVTVSSIHGDFLLDSNSNISYRCSRTSITGFTLVNRGWKEYL